MGTISEKFHSNLIKHQLIQDEDRIYVAVSGGPDSVALAYLFLEVREEFRLQLRLVHFNHQYRGRAADEDQQFVREFANKAGLELLSESGDVKAFARSQHLSLETAAREMRYGFFERVLAQDSGSKIALGHHADDQAETILDRFLRGAGLKGMSGMRWRRDRFIRPLLDIPRTELLAYLNRSGALYRLDASNQDLNFRRNRIRHRLLPLLQQQFNPSVVRVLTRDAEIFYEADAFLNFFAENAFNQCLLFRETDKIILDIFKFLQYFTVVQKYIIFQALTKFAIRPEELSTFNLNQIIQLAKSQKPEKKMVLRQRCRIGVWQNQLVFDAPERPKHYYRLDPVIAAHWLHLGRSLRISKSPAPKTWTPDPNVEYVDGDKLAHTLILRSPQPGDRFFPIHSPGSKKVAAFLSDERVPYYRRGEMLVLESDEKIVWLVGMRLDDRFKVTQHSQQVLKLEYYSD